MTGDAGKDEYDQLFRAAPTEFVARRDQWARELRSEGQPGLAAEVKALRRPTQGAWLVNLLARERSDVVGQLGALGAALREAQGGLDAGALRELSARRRAVVDALVRDAARIGAAAGSPPTAEVRAEVQATLEAALVDPAVADEVCRGRLQRPVSRVGFGLPDLAGASAPAVSRPRAAAATRAKPESRSPRAAQDRRERERELARRALEEAEAAHTRARRRADEASRAAAAAEAAEADVARQLRELRERMTDVERHVAEAALDSRARRREAERAQEDAAKADAALQRAQARLDGLTDQ